MRVGRPFLVLCCGLLHLTAKPVASQDTVRIRASEAPQWGDVRLAPVFTIGQLDGPPEYAFGSIRFAAPDGNGGVYIYDDKDRQIRHYDARGRFLAAVGRMGSGPGEYRYVSGMAVYQDSLLVVCDVHNGRITIYRPAGKVHRMLSWPRGAYAEEHDCSADSGGHIYRFVLFPRVAAGEEGGVNAPRQYLRLTLSGQSVDSFFVGSPSTHGRLFYLFTPDGVRQNFPLRNVAAPYVHGGGYVVGHTSTYRFTIHRPGGRSLTIERAQRPVPLWGEERAGWVAWAEYFDEGGGPQEAYVIPREKPAFRGLASDDSGRVWVHLYVAAERRERPPRQAGDDRPLLRWFERNTYDVYAGTGAYLGKVTLPAGTELLAITGNRLYLKQSGPDDEDQLSVQRLVIASARSPSR